MMEWIDRYVYAVANYLPEKNREDISQELKSSLYEQMEDKREELGREPDAEDQKAFLERLGHPMKVAAGYTPQQYLIGPSLFPYFRHTMKLALSIVIAIQIAITIVTLFISPEIADKIPGLITRMMYAVALTAGCVVGGFAIAEYSGEKLDWYDSWKPSSLPSVTSDLWIDRTDNIINIVAETVMLLWWNGAIGFSNTISDGDSTLSLALSEGWNEFYWPVNLILLGSIILHCHHLFMEQWTVSKATWEVVVDLASLAVLYFLLQIEPMVISIGGEEDMSRIASGINDAMWYILVGITVICLYELYKHAGILYRLKQYHDPDADEV